MLIAALVAPALLVLLAGVLAFRGTTITHVPTTTTTAKKGNSMKLKAKVHFTGRATEGTGRIVEIKESSRGLWYVVERDDGFGTITLRAASIRVL